VKQLRAHRRTIVSVSLPANAGVVVEVAVDDRRGAIAAAAAGADRLELCQSLREGGLSPSAGLVAAVRAAVALPIVAMVRPRAGDFLYETGEFATMLADIAHLRQSGIDGIVTGVLTTNGHVDRDRLQELLAAAAPLPVTFHRAFDLCDDADRALDTLLELGVARLLTSGQAANAPAGAARIASLVQRAAGRLKVIAGAGVRATNVRQLVASTGVREVHLSATTWLPSAMTFVRRDVAMGNSAPVDEYSVRTTDGAQVAQTVAALRGA
jgi:copper homeostasis protein